MNKTFQILLMVPFFFLSCSFNKVSPLNIAGSDTILELSQGQAEDFFRKTKFPVNVTGGGSGVGINEVKEGSLDIANASRELSSTEKTPNLIQVEIAKDLISVVVNKKNPITNLSKKELEGVYTGRIKNWKELGWKDIPISLYGRQSSSGTYQYFQKVILGKKDYSLRVKEMTGNSQLIRSLKEDVGGIAYVAYGYYDSQTQNINLVSIEGIRPSTREDMRAYLLKRGVYQIFDKNNKKIEQIKKWFSYILGEEGESMVSSMGFLPINPTELKAMKKLIGIL